MECVECGAKIARAAQVCARCAAPIARQSSAAAGLTAGWAASAAIPTSAGDNFSQSGPDSEVDGAILARWVEATKFSTTRLRPGYDQEQVNAFLDAIGETFLGIRNPAVSPDEVRNKMFLTTRLRPGYEEEEVDAFLDEAGLRLATQLGVPYEAPARERSAGAARAAQVRCMECGTESAGATGICPRCGAPLAHQWPVAADQATGRRPKFGRSARRNRGLIITGTAVTLLVAGAVAVALTRPQGRPATAASKRLAPVTPVTPGTSARWTYTTGDFVESRPAVASGTVYVGSGDDNLYALDASTGHLVWSYTTGGTIDSGPAVAGGVVYIGSGDGKVYALDAATGRRRWAYTTDGQVDSSATVASGTVYIGDGSGTVYALDAATGQLRWTYTTQNTVDSGAAAADGTVYIGSNDGNVYALNAAS